MAKVHRNSPERVDMLANRYAEQCARGKGRKITWGRYGNMPAWMNRRTREPHLHARQSARRLKQVQSRHPAA